MALEWASSSLSVGSELLPWPPPTTFASSSVDGSLCAVVSPDAATAAADQACTAPAPAKIQHGRAVLETPDDIDQGLMELARRFRRLRLCASLFDAWHKEALRKRPKRHNERRQRLCVALRRWRRRSGRRNAALQLLVKVANAGLRCAFLQLQMPVLLRRRNAARAALLQIIHGRTQVHLAQCWSSEVLLRTAIISWIFLLRERPRQHLPARSAQTDASQQKAERLPSAPFLLSDADSDPFRQDFASSPFMDNKESQVQVPLALPTRMKLPPPPQQLPSRDALVPTARESQSLLLRVQQEGFLRWWRAVRMDMGAEEVAERRRKAALLVLLRQRAQNMIAFQHYVVALQRKAFEALQLTADYEASPRAKRCMSFWASPHRQGLRGVSAAEVMRKGWRRWRYAVSTRQCVLVHAGHRWSAGVTLRLCQIASEIEARSKGQGFPPRPRSSQGRVQREVTPQEPEHLLFLEKALAAFKPGGGLGPPTMLWDPIANTNVAAEDLELASIDVKSHSRYSTRWPVDVVWSPPPPKPVHPAPGPEAWQETLPSADSLQDTMETFPALQLQQQQQHQQQQLPLPGLQRRQQRLHQDEAHASESYEALRRRIRAAPLASVRA